MTRDPRFGLDMAFLLATSTFALFLVASLFIYPPHVEDDFPFRKTVTEVTFISVSVLGIIAVFKPKICSHTVRQGLPSDVTIEKAANSPVLGASAQQASSLVLNIRIVHGHHPNCDGFSGHEFRVGDKTFCAGCMGLLLGAVSGIIAALAYFSYGWQITQQLVLAAAVGLTGIIVGLLQTVISGMTGRSFPRILLNAFFIFSMFLILASADTLIGSTVLNIFLISVDLFWLYSRISISHWNHRRICSTCGQACELSMV